MANPLNIRISRALPARTEPDVAPTAFHDVMTCRKPICVETARIIRERER